MARITAPKLNLQNPIDGYLKDCKAGNTRPDRCEALIVGEIEQQGAIFARAHQQAADLFVALHESTQAAYRAGLQFVKEAGPLNTAPPSTADRLKSILDTKRDLVVAALQDFDEVGKEMNHQLAWRQDMICSESLGAEVLGAQVIERMRKRFIQLRTPPFSAFIAASAFEKRVQEHLVRIEDLIRDVEMRAGAADKERSELTQRAEEIVNTNSKILKALPGDLNKIALRRQGWMQELKVKLKEVKEGKTSVQEATDWAKQIVSGHEKYEAEFKNRSSQLKSCRLRYDELLRLAKEQSSIKTLATQAKEMRKEIDGAMKMFEDHRAKLLASHKAFAKAPTDFAKLGR